MYSIALWSVHTTYGKRRVTAKPRDGEGSHGQVCVGVDDTFPDCFVAGRGIE